MNPPRLLDMPPLKALWTVAWPVAALGLLRSTFFLADAAWVGRLGAAELEGVGASSFASWMIHASTDMVAVGLQALVARAVGAGRPERVQQLANQSLWLALVLSTGMLMSASTAPAAYFSLLGMAGQEFGASLDAGTAYLTVLLLGSPGIVLFLVMHALFRGVGDTRTPMLITAGTLVVNIILDPLLLFGWGPFPELGVRGAAVATVLVQSAGAVVGFVLLSRYGARPGPAAPDFDLQTRVVRISAPISIASLGFCLVYVFLGPIVTHFGSGPMAALAVGHRIESIGYLFAIGVGTAVATLVGQNLGAHRPEAAARIAVLAEGLIIAVLGPLAIVYFVAAPWIFGFFSDDPTLVNAGVGYLRWAAPALIFVGLEVLYESGFSGAGNTVPATAISLPLTAMRIPLAWFLSQHTPLGLDGVWIAIAASTVAKGIVLRFWWAKGNWQRRLGADA